MTTETEVGLPDFAYFPGVERPGGVTGNGRERPHLPLRHNHEAVERPHSGALAKERRLDVALRRDMLAETEEGRIAVTFTASNRLGTGIVGEEGGKTELVLPLEVTDVAVGNFFPCRVGDSDKGLATGCHRRNPPPLIQRQREGVKGPVVLGFAEGPGRLIPLDEVHPRLSLIVTGVATVTLHHRTGMTGEAFHALVADDGMFGSAGDNLAFVQLAAALAAHEDLLLFFIQEDIGVLAPLGSQNHLHAGMCRLGITAAFAQRIFVLTDNCFQPRPISGAAMAILTGDLHLQVKIFVSMGVPHDVPGGMTIDAIHPLAEMDIRGDGCQVPGPTGNSWSGLSVKGRHHRIVAIIESLVRKGNPAAAVVTAHTDSVIRQSCHLVTHRMRPLSFDGWIAPLIGCVLIGGEVAGSATRPVTPAPDIVGSQAYMAECTELAIEFAGQIVKPRYSLQMQGATGSVKSLFRPGGVKDAVFPFPGLLDILDHAGIGVHQAGADSLQLELMAGATSLFPVTGIRRILWSVHSPVRGLFVPQGSIPAVAGDAAGMGFRCRLQTLVAADAGGVGPERGSAVATCQQQKDEQQSKYVPAGSGRK